MIAQVRGMDLDKLSLKELWELFPIELTAHRNEWKNSFAREAENLKVLLPNVEPYHIGSTAIPEIMAKNTVDILICFPDRTAETDAAAVLSANGWTEMARNDRRISLNKGYTPSGYADEVFHLHLRLDDDKDEIYFCRYLAVRPNIAKEYEKLKFSLAEKFRFDRDAYTDGKTDFVQKYTAEAIEYFSRNSKKPPRI